VGADQRIRADWKEWSIVLDQNHMLGESVKKQPSTAHYPIGTPGIAWGAAERAAWLGSQRQQRSYADEVVAPLKAQLPAQAELLQYGELDYSRLGLGSGMGMDMDMDMRVHALYAVRSRTWNPDRPVAVVTGGVHGYETSGVQGALLWTAREFARAAEAVNLLVLPCISPWAYETINRWNPDALDPNRHFMPNSPVAEAALAMACVAAHEGRIDLHIDLHETTDTDNSEFGPAKAARDGLSFDGHDIPEGFYLVGDAERPVPDFQRALIEAVSRVTPIAAADARGCIIGTRVQQPGVIHFAQRSRGLCGGMTDARFVTTTEVYPDSPATSAAQCNQAQAAAVSAALAYLLRS